MNCPKCGFEIKKRNNFCPYCGENLKDQVEVEIIDSDSDSNEDISKNKVFAILSYFSFLFVLSLIFAPNSKFAKYHANQGVALCIFTVIASAVADLVIVFEIFKHYVEYSVDVITLCFVIYGVYNACKGRCKPLPLIGKFKILK